MIFSLQGTPILGESRQLSRQRDAINVLRERSRSMQQQQEQKKRPKVVTLGKQGVSS